jgi:hypothetical protein
MKLDPGSSFFVCCEQHNSDGSMANVIIQACVQYDNFLHKSQIAHEEEEEEAFVILIVWCETLPLLLFFAVSSYHNNAYFSDYLRTSL